MSSTPDFLYEAYQSFPCSSTGYVHSNDNERGGQTHQDLAAPLPADFYASMSLLPSYHLDPTAVPDIINRKGSIFRRLRLQQQTAFRKANKQKEFLAKGPSEEQIVAAVDIWMTTASSTISPDYLGNTLSGLHGDERLHSSYAKVATARDGYACLVCGMGRGARACCLVPQDFKEDQSQYQWLKSTGILPVFRKDSPVNISTLCSQHRKSMITEPSWCLVPSVPDHEALIAYELEDSRMRGTAQGQPRTVPPPYMLSGWYEVVPLTKDVLSETFGNYRFQRVGSTPFQIACRPLEGAPANPRCFLDERSGSLLLWMGLVDPFPQAILAYSKALLAVQGPGLTLRVQLLKAYSEILHEMYGRTAASSAGAVTADSLPAEDAYFDGARKPEWHDVADVYRMVKDSLCQSSIEQPDGESLDASIRELMGPAARAYSSEARETPSPFTTWVTQARAEADVWWGQLNASLKPQFRGLLNPPIDNIVRNAAKKVGNV